MKRKKKSHWVAGVAQFHDYIFSKYSDWPKTKWVHKGARKVTPDEEERCERAKANMLQSNRLRHD